MEQKLKLMTERKLFTRLKMELFGDFYYQERDSQMNQTPACLKFGTIYRFWNLYKGNYKVTVSANGFKSVTTNITVIKNTLFKNFTLAKN